MNKYIFFLFGLFIFAACSTDSEDELLGQWKRVAIVETNSPDTLLMQTFIYDFMASGKYNYELWMQECKSDSSLIGDRTIIESYEGSEYSVDKQFVYLSATNEVLTYRLDGDILWLGTMKYIREK